VPHNCCPSAQSPANLAMRHLLIAGLTGEFELAIVMKVPNDLKHA
jgi:hypothetical protein